MNEPSKALAWDDFRLIKAVAETRNLPAAAGRLGINHSTVFRRLNQIEAMLGTALFERHRAGYALTSAGEEIAALAARVDADITEVTRRLAGQELLPSGELRVATSDSLLIHLFTPLFARFRQACPGVRLDIVIGNAAANLSRRDADIAIRASDTPPETLVGRRAANIAWALYGRADGPAGPGPESEWVSMGDNMAALKVVQHMQKTVPAERIAYRVNTVLGLAEAVEAGMGFGYLPCFLADTRPALRRLGPLEPAFGSELWLLTHPDLRQAPRVRALLDFIAQEIAALRPLIEGQVPLLPG
ncbi:LysR family transcriptional regulator [Acetobacteraceae bacterium H6797]|nr:LysR family transcriptional regulator [Acetobacteraceae bacterium H6797]